LIALILLLIGLTIGRILGRIVYHILKEFNLSGSIKKSTKIKISPEKVISNFIKYFIYFVTIIMTLTQLGISTTTLNILMAAIILIILIILFFILNYFLPNIIAGIFIKQKNFIKDGDKIRFNDKQGEIISINLIETIIKSKDSSTIYIPNSVLAKKEITKIQR
jgi:small-conductance mechanosensitive channel